ncbi:MAG: hypothetical protein P8Z37_13775 [Acidobacteriota bacterium]|jgi:hypothetical protein
MTDWADSLEIRNNGIKCVVDKRILSELLRSIISLVLIAGALLFYSWTRSKIVEMGYETQRLCEFEETLLENEMHLIAEEEWLTSPRRIGIIATRDLGMTKLRPTQMILPPLEAADQGISNSLAMADSEKDNLEKSGEVTRLRNYSAN